MSLPVYPDWNRSVVAQDNGANIGGEIHLVSAGIDADGISVPSRMSVQVEAHYAQSTPATFTFTVHRRLRDDLPTGGAPYPVQASDPQVVFEDMDNSNAFVTSWAIGIMDIEFPVLNTYLVIDYGGADPGDVDLIVTAFYVR